MERGVRGLTVHQLFKLAKALKVSADDLLMGGNGSHETKPPTSLKLLRSLHRIEKLPEGRQRMVVKLIDALIDQESHR
jgi:hypothetical protein